MPGASTQPVLCLLYTLLYSHIIVFSWVGLALPLRILLVASLYVLRTRVRRAVLHDSYPNHAVAPSLALCGYRDSWAVVLGT